MKERTKVLIKRIAGAILIVIGIGGIFFPIVPGWLLIFVGLEIVGIQLAFFDKIKEYAKEQIDKRKKRGQRNDKSRD